MKYAITFFVLLTAIYAALIAQEFLPSFPQFGGAHLQFVPLIFCIGALALPYPLMLPLALASGFLFDLMQMQFVNNQPEIPFGTTVFFFLLTGAVCQGFRPLFLRRHWYLAGILGGVSTALLLGLQFALLSIRRFESGGFEWTPDIAWRVLFPAFAAFFAAPLCFFVARLILGPFPFRAREPLYQ